MSHRLVVTDGTRLLVKNWDYSTRNTPVWICLGNMASELVRGIILVWSQKVLMGRLQVGWLNFDSMFICG